MTKISINCVPMDNSACGFYRIINISELLRMNPNYEIMLCPPGKFLYTNNQYYFTQRAIGTKNMETLLNLKRKTNTQWVVDFDDIIWEPLPKYNLCPIDWQDNLQSIKNGLDELADVIIVSTVPIKESLAKYVNPSKIWVIPNMLPRWKWNYPRLARPTTDSILYAGSPTHYDNSKHNYGDFTIEWDKFLQGKVVNTMGIPPWFINSTNNYGWTNMIDYSHYFYGVASKNKFVIAPLANNFFNKCKSDLKYLECCAVGRVCLCSDFEDSPYTFAHPLQKVPVNATTKQIEYIMKECDKHYDEIIEYQYKYLNERWLDNNIDLYTNIFNPKKASI